MMPSDSAAGVQLRARQLARYFLTGGAAAIVDLGGFVLFVSGGMAVAQAAVLSFLAALIVNYFLSSRFAFGRNVNVHTFLLFVGFASAGLLINVGVTVAAFAVLGIAPLSKAIGIGLAFLFNFAVNAFIVFR
jgi:putative flippase GtrA